MTARLRMTCVTAAVAVACSACTTRGDLTNQFNEIVLQLRQVGAALAAYKTDHAGKLPDRLTNLVSEGYAPSNSLICAADPSHGHEGGKPEAYPNHVIGPQYEETDETGSSLFYEFSSAPCSWYWEGYLQATPQELDRDTNGIVSWAEVKLFQLANGDICNGFKPYPPPFFPVVRCHWCQYPAAAAMSSNGVELTVINLGYDLQTVFASSLQWELDQVGKSTSDPPELRNLRCQWSGANDTLFLDADEIAEFPLWPKMTELTNLSYSLLAPVVEGQSRVYGRIRANVFRWKPRLYSPSNALVLVQLSVDGVAATTKCYRTSVTGTDSMKIAGVSHAAQFNRSIVEWNAITDATYHVDVTTNLFGEWLTNVFSASGSPTRMYYTNDSSESSSLFFRLRVRYNDM